MNCFTKLAAVVAVSVCTLSLSSGCSDDQSQSKQPAPQATPAAKEPNQHESMTAMETGVAGGMVQDTFTTTAKVTDIDQASRQITLVGEDGSKATFVAGPEIKNFDQIHTGDTVSAKLTQRLTIYVRSSDEDPSMTHAAALASAPKGAKPGATLAQSYEVVAKVVGIDAAKRTADLKFSDGQTITVPVRADVELSRYKVGDSVVIKVMESLTVLVKSA